LFELGVDDAAFLFLLAALGRGSVRGWRGPAVRSWRAAARARVLVHDAREAVRLFLELLEDVLDRGVVLLLDRGASVLDAALDLRYAARRRHDPFEMELAERPVVTRFRAFALEDVHLDGGLAVGRRREDLLLLRRDRRVSADHDRHHAAERLDAERERRDVEE